MNVQDIMPNYKLCFTTDEVVAMRITLQDDLDRLPNEALARFPEGQNRKRILLKKAIAECADLRISELSQ